MRPLMLDFQPRRRSSPLGWSLLAGGVVLALTCTVIQQHLSEQAEQQQGHLHMQKNGDRAKEERLIRKDKEKGREGT